MDTMNALVIILVVLAVAASVVAVVYILLKQYFDRQREELGMQWREKKRKEQAPLQIQAFERLILFLERINPERLVFRVNKPGMSARLLQAEIHRIIREEFDHNLAQQLYISSNAWESIKSAREETVKLLNRAAERVHKDDDSMALSKAILEVIGEYDKLPTDVAIEILKREFRKSLGN